MSRPSTRSRSTSPNKQHTTRRSGSLSLQKKQSTQNASPDTSTMKTDKKTKHRRQVKLMEVGGKTFKINVTTLREIKKLQYSTSLLLPRSTFGRLVSEVIYETTGERKFIQKEAVEAIQEAAELYMVQFFEDAYACCHHARRCTLIPRDMGLISFVISTTD